MKRAFIYIVILTVIGTISLIELKNFQNSQTPNSFNRKFVKMRVDLLNFYELKDNHYTFVNKTKQSLVLRHYSDLFNLFKLNFSLNYVDTIKLIYPSTFLNNGEGVSVDILNNNIFSINSSGILYLPTNTKSSTFNSLNVQVDKLQAISANTVIVRRVDRNTDKTMLDLSKFSLDKQVLPIIRYSLPKIKDSFFANDGYLHYDKITNRIFYMYYYKGLITCLDTNLRLQYLSKTIDTIKTAKIETKVLESENNGYKVKALTMTKPPTFVNYYITTYNKLFFILPKLRADNENESISIKNDVVDVYDTGDGKYKYSFYIPKYRNLNLREFLVTEKLLFALFGKYIVSYRIKWSHIR